MSRAGVDTGRRVIARIGSDPREWKWTITIIFLFYFTMTARPLEVVLDHSTCRERTKFQSRPFLQMLWGRNISSPVELL